MEGQGAKYSLILQGNKIENFSLLEIRIYCKIVVIRLCGMFIRVEHLKHIMESRNRSVPL